MYSLEQELDAADIEYIKNKLAENVRIIDEGMKHYLDVPTNGNGYEHLIEAMRYSALSGGKRIRGFLTRECFEVFNGYIDDEMVLPIACAIEMIHAYSLIHDDLPCMDDDDMRRGQPSCHIKFGESTAILAGDALLALAFNIVADADKISPENKIKIIAELSRAAGYSGMVGGQVIDLGIAAQSFSPDSSKQKTIDVIKLIKLHTMKTGALIIAAARIGCIAAGVSAEYTGRGKPEKSPKNEIELISEYAKNIALAFQVVDDTFDNDGFAAFFGNPEDTAEYARKLTLEALLNLEKLKEINSAINVKSLQFAAKYLLYREY